MGLDKNGGDLGGCFHGDNAVIILLIDKEFPLSTSTLKYGTFFWWVNGHIFDHKVEGGVNFF